MAAVEQPVNGLDSMLSNLKISSYNEVPKGIAVNSHRTALVNGGSTPTSEGSQHLSSQLPASNSISVNSTQVYARAADNGDSIQLFDNTSQNSHVLKWHQVYDSGINGYVYWPQMYQYPTYHHYYQNLNAHTHGSQQAMGGHTIQDHRPPVTDPSNALSAYAPVARDYVNSGHGRYLRMLTSYSNAQNSRFLAPAHSNVMYRNPSVLSSSGSMDDSLANVSGGNRITDVGKTIDNRRHMKKPQKDSVKPGMTEALCLDKTLSGSSLTCSYTDAKFFIIKSYSEENVHKSIRFSVWSSTASGNRKLDEAYQEAQLRARSNPNGCPVFLFFSVNGSRQFCGVAEMVGSVDFSKSMPFWEQQKWAGSFPVKWHIVKDLPNSQLRHIILENNEYKPVTNSRDGQEVKLQLGLEMLNIFKNYPTRTSILENCLLKTSSHPTGLTSEPLQWNSENFPKLPEVCIKKNETGGEIRPRTLDTDFMNININKWNHLSIPDSSVVPPTIKRKLEKQIP